MRLKYKKRRKISEKVHKEKIKDNVSVTRTHDPWTFRHF